MHQGSIFEYFDFFGDFFQSKEPVVNTTKGIVSNFYTGLGETSIPGLRYITGSIDTSKPS